MNYGYLIEKPTMQEAMLELISWFEEGEPLMFEFKGFSVDTDGRVFYHFERVL